MKKILIASLLIAFIAVACSKVAITNRRQIKLIPKSMMLNMSKQNYVSFLQENPATSNAAKSGDVKKVGQKISAAVEQYLRENGQEKRLSEFAWEFNVVESNDVNAWAMPGGKTVFYTGILPVCQDETGIAVVMGHEIAHAIAEHGNERVSQGLIAQGLAIGGQIAISETIEKNPQLVGQVFQQSFGIGSQLGIMAFGRKQELEADQLGLVFMTMAGYDPNEAIKFWERMDALSGGQAPPEFMSTHPHNQKRIAKIKAFIPEALKYKNGTPPKD